MRVDAVMRAAFGISTGLLLTGSGAALVLAYVLRFLAISAGGIEAGLAKVSPHLDMAARSLGSRPAKVLRDHPPAADRARRIAAAAMLVFVDCMKELPATLLLQPFNFTTLATALYGEAKRGTYEDGAIAALAIVLVGLIPVIVLARVNAGPVGARAAGSRQRCAEARARPSIGRAHLETAPSRTQRAPADPRIKLQRLRIGERLLVLHRRAHARRRAPRAR